MRARVEGMTGAEAVAAVVSATEDPVVFGMPGGYTMHIFDALFDLGDAVETHLVRAEALASVMAEARGRLTNRPSFVVGQGQWILGSAGIGIMEAHLGASPVVILMDATDGGPFSHLGPYQAGFGGYGAVDLAASMNAITKRTFVANDPTQALQMTQLAIKHATSGEPGPVAVIFHGRSLFDRVDPSAQPPAYLDAPFYGNSRALPVNPSDIVELAASIRAAERPVIVAGNGMRLGRAESALESFAEATGIPVATTPAGKGVFPEDNPLSLGVIGVFGHETANEGVGKADLVLAVATKLGATDTANLHADLINADRQVIAQIDLEPLNLGWTFAVAHAVRADAATALRELQKALDGGSTGRDRVASLRKSYPRPASFDTADGLLSGRAAVRVLSEEAPAESVVTCDAGENRLYVLQDFVTKRGGTVLQPNGGGGMGYAIPAATAAAMLPGERPAIAVVGDGGFAMTLHGLLTSVELGAKMLVVVLNNMILGWVYHGQRERLIASEFNPVDYAAIAESIGCHATTVTTAEDLRVALSSAWAREGVSVVVVHTSVQDRYQDVMSRLQTNDVYSVPVRI